jgi:glycerol kinase
MSGTILALDQGTTGTKVHALAEDGAFSTRASFTHRQILPRAGWVEHDPEELIAHLKQGLAYAGDAVALGIANQGETVVAWDAATGRPLANAIVWQDARTQDDVERLKAEGAEAETLARAGLPLDPYFSATKLRWLIDNAPDAKDLLAAGRLRLGTSDAFFLDRLAGTYATDVTTASRTSLMNLETRDWDPELCRIFRVPIEALPPIGPTAGAIAEIATGGRTIRVTASAVDQQAALHGHLCRRPGQAKVTFGTGAFALTLTGPAPLRDSASGLLPTVAWAVAGEAPVYALDGGVYNAASAVNWARGLGLFEGFDEIAEFDGPSAIERGLVFVPALSGLGGPHWDRSAAGLWLGMGLETDRRDLVRAMLEGIALRTAELLAAMGRLAPLDGPVSIDGGLSANPYFRRFLARALGRPLAIPATVELTGLGIALLARAGSGIAGAAADAERMIVAPEAPLDTAMHHRFADAIRRCRGWR